MKSKLVSKRKKIALVMVALAMSLVIGGTMAYYAVRTPYIENCFTFGNIELELKETAREYIIVPGCTIDKDPRVVVKKGSEASWIFVKLEDSDALADLIEYDVDNSWTQLKDSKDRSVSGVYYREEAAVQNKDKSYEVLADNQVRVKESVGKSQLDALTRDDTLVGITITAYAIQKNGITSAYSAWTKLAEKLK